MTATDSTGAARRSRIRRRLLIIAAALGAAAVPASLAPIPSLTTRPDPTARPAPAATAGSSAPPATDRGSTLYLQSCASCHGQRGEGTQRGPSLVGVGAASVDFQLSTGRMPLTGVAAQPPHRKPAFSAEDIDALVRHVTSFGGDGPPVPTVGGGDLRTGRRLYIDNCAACHSASGIGGALTNGRYAPALDRATPTQVAEAIRVGPGFMPAFPGTALTDQQVDDVVSYVQTLKGGRLDQGGASLGRLGPFTEGLVGLGVGLLLPVLVARLLGRRAGQ